jgi:hypothetical protein
MNWLNWVWIDWEIPARQRVNDAGAILEALRPYGDPEKPNAAHMVIFRAACDMFPESQQHPFLPPDKEWIDALYQDFLNLVRKERPDWLKKKAGSEHRKVFDQARKQQRQADDRLSQLRARQLAEDKERSQKARSDQVIETVGV